MAKTGLRGIGLGNRHGWRGLAGAVAGAVLAALALMPSGAFAGACSASITACCTIKTPGSYKVTKSLTSAGNCINIAVPKVFLNLEGFTLTGSGTGTGINILSTSRNVAILDGTIKDFDNGVVTDAPGVALVELASESNLSNGIVFGGPGNLVFDAVVGLNKKNGILVKPLASSTALIGAEVAGNTRAGVAVSLASSFFAFEVDGVDNGTFGFWLRGSSNGMMLGAEAENNGIAGVYLGCSPTGPGSTTCASLGLTPASDNNILENNIENTAAQKFGVAIDPGNARNHVVVNNNNGHANSTFDLIDENPTCGSNIWYLNTFTTSKPGKDAVSPFCID